MGQLTNSVLLLLIIVSQELRGECEGRNVGTWWALWYSSKGFGVREVSEWILVWLLSPVWLWESYQTSLRCIFLVLQRAIIMSRAEAAGFLDTLSPPDFLGLQLNYITQAPLQGGTSLWLDLARACASLGLVLLYPHSSFCWLQPGQGDAAFSTLTRAIQYRTGGTKGRSLAPKEHCCLMSWNSHCFVREKAALFLKPLFSSTT